MNNLQIELKALQSFCNLLSETPTEIESVTHLCVTKESFANPELGSLWAYLSRVAEQRRKPDPISAIKALDGVVSPNIITEVFVSNEPPVSAIERLSWIRMDHVRRGARIGLRQIDKLFENTKVDIENAVGELKKFTETIHAPAYRRKTLGDHFISMLDRMEEIAAGRLAPIIQTKIPALDQAIGGFQQTLTIIGAYTGVGKSALVAALIRNAAMSNVRVGVLSIEDPGAWIPERITAQMLGVPIFSVKTKPLTRAQLDSIHERAPLMHQMLSNIECDDRLGMGTQQVIESARTMIRNGCKVIILDHLGEIRLKRTDRHDLDISDAVSELTTLANTYGIAMVVVCHMKRTSNDAIYDEPRITDFAFSSGIEKKARVALGLWRTKGREDFINCSILKQTSGRANFVVKLGLASYAGIVTNDVVLDLPPEIRRTL